MAQHYITKCSCGAVLAQCRCPHPNKAVNIVERGCEACHSKSAQVKLESHNPEVWKVTDSRGMFVLLSTADWRDIASIIHNHYHGED